MHVMYVMVNIKVVIVIINKSISISLIHILHGSVVNRTFLYIFTETLD